MIKSGIYATSLKESQRGDRDAFELMLPIGHRQLWTHLQGRLGLELALDHFRHALGKVLRVRRQLCSGSSGPTLTLLSFRPAIEIRPSFVK